MTSTRKDIPITNEFAVSLVYAAKKFPVFLDPRHGHLIPNGYTFRKWPSVAVRPAAALMICILVTGNAGCVVKQTGGLKVSEMERVRCESRIGELMSMYGVDSGSSQLQEAKGLYNDARARVNGWLQGVEVVLKIEKKLDVPESDFEPHRAAVDKFLNYGEKPKSLSVLSFAAVFHIINRLNEFNVQKRKEVVRIQKMLREMHWQSFEDVAKRSP